MELEMNCAFAFNDSIVFDTEANSRGIHVNVKQGSKDANMVLSKEDQKKLFLLLADELNIEYIEPIKLNSGGLAKGFEATYLDGYEEFRNSVARFTESFPQAETVESLSKRFDRLEKDLAKFNEKAFDDITEVENEFYRALNPLIDRVRVLEAADTPLRPISELLNDLIDEVIVKETLERLGND